MSGLGEVSGGLDPAEALLDAFAPGVGLRHSPDAGWCACRSAVRRGSAGLDSRTLPSMAMCGVILNGPVRSHRRRRPRHRPCRRPDPSIRRPLPRRSSMARAASALGHAPKPGSAQHRRSGRCGFSINRWPMKQSRLALAVPLAVTACASGSVVGGVGLGSSASGPGSRARRCIQAGGVAVIVGAVPGPEATSSRPRRRSACRRPRNARPTAAALHPIAWFRTACQELGGAIIARDQPVPVLRDTPWRPTPERPSTDPRTSGTAGCSPAAPSAGVPSGSSRTPAAASARKQLLRSDRRTTARANRDPRTSG